MKKLNQAEVPVIFRPLHEASGQWFWWGAQGPEPCKQLWKLIFHRLTDVHKLNNLIWVWTTDTQANNMDWYPGDEFVDILGVDIYAANGNHESQVLTFNQIREDFKGKKMITLSENGVNPDPDELMADRAGWSWFMTWYGSFVRNSEINPLSMWQKIMNHDYVLTRDELPRRYGSTKVVDNKTLGTFFKINQLADSHQISIQPSNVDVIYDVFIYSMSGKLIFNDLNIKGPKTIHMTHGSYGIHLIRFNLQNSSKTIKFML